MKKAVNINSISDFHRLLGLKKPKHPLISITNSKEYSERIYEGRYQSNLYIISIKKECNNSFTYGRNSFDFQEGTFICSAPRQVFNFDNSFVENKKIDQGWTIVFHPDFIRHSELAKTITEYSFFEYGVYEALHISDQEKKTMLGFIKNIKTEIEQNVDKHSQEIIIINLESILKYGKRYYDRQFYTRSHQNKDYIIKIEKYLKSYFASSNITDKGLPTVQQCGEALHISGYYLSDLLKVETGKSALEHIHLQLVEQAKNKLIGSSSTISQIAFDLGFQYPQHFSKLFKSKAGYSPTEYRNLN